ncbi:PREDICTED: peroxisomal bifunctional enzyme-like [Branchiostoma belcheri]|uniref:Peroxisomal bifunctional enzyme n=1 Tax=Branchiostoma belcheri TaxID=7741 RepID=A0A6P4YIT0_BRABE|nr:PREDICTED: peroxisomal bifunctional enzyme-like [Branchiostoma belcheri]
MAEYSTYGSVAVLQVNNPPLNTFTRHVLQALVSGLERAQRDPAVRSIVIAGKGPTFPAGADLEELLGTAAAPLLSNLRMVDKHVDTCQKPIVCAIHGTALGGGFELALASHYRLAVPSATLSLPEVHLGMLPGAGGTQRLPRVVGVKSAIQLITSGQDIKAQQALTLGLVDKIVQGDLLKEAVSFARSVEGRPLEDRRISQRTVPDADKVDEVVEATRKTILRKARGAIAPLTCVQAIQASVLPFAAGMAREADLMTYLMTSWQAAAQQYVFFSEREVRQWSHPRDKHINFRTAKPTVIKSVGVVGAGTMGAGITISLLQAGLKVVLLEVNKKQLDKAIAVIQKTLRQKSASQKMSQLTTTMDYSQLSDVDMVIEAVFENLRLKKEVFRKLDVITKPQAVLASNTSGLDIDKIAAATKRPDKVVGTHFFSPANVMRLLENIYGKKTSAETVATVMQLATTIGKVGVLVGNCAGFVGNRMLGPYRSEALFLLEEGVDPQDVDRAIEEFGFPMGPFRMTDLAGNDIGWRRRIEARLTTEHGPPPDTPALYRRGDRYCPLPDMLCLQGRLGQKTGAGCMMLQEAKDDLTENIYIRFRTDGSVFDLRRLLAHTKTLEELILDLLFADDCALLAHTEAALMSHHAPSMCNRYDPGSRTALPDPVVLQMIQDYRQEHGFKKRTISSQEIVERCLYSLINEGFHVLDEGIASRALDIDVIYLFGYGWPRHTGGPMYYVERVIGLEKLLRSLETYSARYPNHSHLQPSPLLRDMVAKGGSLAALGTTDSKL